MKRGNQLNYKRLKLLAKNKNLLHERDEMAFFLGRSPSGMYKALPNRSIYAHDILDLADAWEMSTDDVFKFLLGDENVLNESAGSYAKTPKKKDSEKLFELVSELKKNAPKLLEAVAALKEKEQG